MYKDMNKVEEENTLAEWVLSNQKYVKRDNLCKPRQNIRPKQNAMVRSAFVHIQRIIVRKGSL